MLRIYEANPLTFLIISGSMMVTPFYLLVTYTFSGASSTKGVVMGSIWLLFGALMSWICLADVTTTLGEAGNLIVPLAWLLPSTLLAIFRKWALDSALSQKLLVGLQLFRAIGGTFLIEMPPGYVPAVFAYPAGLGDIAVAVIAAVVLVVCRHRPDVPASLIILVIVAGVADFISAFFFGFTSSESPVQLFFPEQSSQLIAFPTGLIPLFLVPYAIFFHTLSWLNLKRFPGQKLPVEDDSQKLEA